MSDPDKAKRIQAHIIGLTAGVKDEALPWAFSLDDQTLVPEVGEAVWIFVEKLEGEEDYDYSRQYYQRYSEILPKEAYDYSKSDAYSLRKEGRLTNEPSDVSSVEYPKNRVIKLSGITMEYDEGNERYIITDMHGNYVCLSSSGISQKSQSDGYLGASGGQTIETKDGLEVLAGVLPSEKMMLGETWKQVFDALKQYINLHTHISAAPGVSTTPPSSPFINVQNYLSDKNKNN